MTVNLFLVRHGAHGDLGQVLTGRRGGVPLTGQGRAQAAAVAERLTREDVRAVHTSPRQRAVETAEIIAERIGATVEIVDALDEIDFGEWSGRSFDDLAGDAAWNAWNARRGSTRPPEGETMDAAVARARQHVAALAGQGGGVVCVSHCDIIRGLVADALGLDFDKLLRFDVDTASLSTLLVGSWGSRVLGLNERAAA
ncbi:MAG: histidine phosphatase family protein [Sphingomonas bacterium]|nr:histidine phosphatase family protein [Sphingomonas bacterium]MDB5688337.1 histidine phosphatase family protein [Sphingomonas bacterium]